ncbi:MULTISPECIES: transporter substrate-binding domain-containing protein [unclassified Pseudomonas]|jgi:ABC-type amino acid transport substrate-binding protein|uniref:substrate-binding periplasmic protein n=1 Tax=unclassified Pseudomonas TaxID=196821 RepID=UPI000A0C4C78|nr:MULTISPECIES: transporter substrate-binding domain-containing protein [unclassified Pseudomonas]SMF05012.1 amino acid ABC transporter substrate-binding protein, PAAT family [Pseudomonas sp. LAIL14HWK12:I11]SMR72615.1 amino acid ABC transporter substrate-binding protein, PAAT family [Pseudomonas sp. LAIL14HWK12:I10]SOD01511.1 amino acid ABC transporter substrate-binding protein, PAAT family [Pseudomonas sp. LAIL14HWK12:I8]
MVLRKAGGVLACMAALLAPGAMAAGKCERLVATGSPDAPPYSWQDPKDPKHLIGANVDLLQQVASELGVKVDVLSAGRRDQALEEVRSGRMDLLLDTPLQVGQLTALDYIHPPLQLNEYLVWTRHDAELAFEGPADLAKYQGSLSERARLTPAFEAFAKAHLKLQPAQNLTQAFQKLVLGQVDYVLAGRYSGMAMTQSLGMSNDLIARGLPVDRPGLYLAVSHNSACNDSWLRGQLAKKLTELPISGASEAVLQRNVERWKAQMQVPLDAPKH